MLDENDLTYDEAPTQPPAKEQQLPQGWSGLLLEQSFDSKGCAFEYDTSEMEAEASPGKRPSFKGRGARGPAGKRAGQASTFSGTAGGTSFNGAGRGASFNFGGDGFAFGEPDPFADAILPSL